MSIPIKIPLNSSQNTFYNGRNETALHKSDFENSNSITDLLLRTLELDLQAKAHLQSPMNYDFRLLTNEEKKQIAQVINQIEGIPFKLDVNPFPYPYWRKEKSCLSKEIEPPWSNNKEAVCAWLGSPASFICDKDIPPEILKIFGYLKAPDISIIRRLMIQVIFNARYLSTHVPDQCVHLKNILHKLPVLASSLQFLVHTGYNRETNPEFTVGFEELATYGVKDFASPEYTREFLEKIISSVVKGDRELKTINLLRLKNKVEIINKLDEILKIFYYCYLCVNNLILL
jgi:hypothetical protein